MQGIVSLQDEIAIAHFAEFALNLLWNGRHGVNIIFDPFPFLHQTQEFRFPFGRVDTDFLKIAQRNRLDDLNST
jgi:hypothetical protein